MTDATVPANPVIYRSVSAAKGRGALWEQAIFAFWVWLVSSPQFTGDFLLLYPIAAYYTGTFVLRADLLLPKLLKCWYLFPFPLWGMASMVWSDAPSTSFRLSLMMFVTMMMVVHISTRLTRPQIVQAVFIGAGVIAFLSLPQLPGVLAGQTITHYPEKNLFAYRMLMLMTMALAILLDPKQPQLYRGAALGLFPLSFLFVLLGHSASALSLGLGIVLFFFIVVVFWQPSRDVAHMRSVLTLFGSVALAGVVFIVLSVLNINPYTEYLDAVGKEATLTGRTALWDFAQQQIDLRPWLGIGPGSFWQASVGEAQTILELNHKAYGTNFSFHNTYLETTVHLGYIGLATLLLALTIAGWKITSNWIESPDLATSALFIFGIATLVRSFSEIDFYMVFNMGPMIYYIGALAQNDREVQRIVFDDPSAASGRAAAAS